MLVIEPNEVGAYVDVADYEAHPALESALDGIECFIDGQPATKIISLSYIVFKDDTQAKMELGRKEYQFERRCKMEYER